MKEPAGIAINDGTHDFYVVDKGDNRVEQFDSEGHFLAQFTGSAAPTGPLASPTSIAVDNSGSPLDPSAGDVYVLDAGHSVIDKFDASGTYIGQITKGAGEAPFGELDGVAVDPSGGLWAYQASGEIDSFSGGLTNEFLAARQSPFGTSPGFAVDSERNLYVNRGAEVVAKLDEGGNTLVGEVDSQRTTAVAVDPSTNDAYIDNVETIARFDTAGTLLERFGTGDLTNGAGIAVEPGSGLVYVADATANVVQRFTPVVVPDVTTGSGSGRETGARLEGVVNPDGLPVSSCEFEYGTTAAYGASAPCAQSPAEIGTGSAPVRVTTTLAGLSPRSTYHFRLAAANGNGINRGNDAAFTTFTPPTVEDEATLEASATTARLAARIDPGGVQTSYTFEYGTSASYGASLPVPAGNAGEGLSRETVTVQPGALQPNTTYHYRAVAINTLGTVAGEDKSFQTQATAAAFTLPDGRQWEMVSPQVKHGGLIEPLQLEGAVQASTDGSAFTFLSEQSLFADAEGGPTFAQVVARRTSGGWVSQDVATAHATALGLGIGEGQEYRLFSPDLSLAIVEPFGPFTPLSPEASERTPYVRTNTTGSYMPLLTAADVPAGTAFGGSPNASTGPVKVLAATPDLRHAILRAEGSLSLTALPTEGGLYEWAAGRLQLVSIRPDETASSGLLGYHSMDTRNAVSTDGSRLFWEGEEIVEGLIEKHLFLRDTTKGRTLQVDATRAKTSEEGNGNPQFQFATADGAKVFFTDQHPLTEDSAAGVGKADLFECEVIEAGGVLTCALKDLTPSPAPAASADVRGFVLGASTDGSSLYLVASGVLAGDSNERGEQATPGANNLYLLQNGGSSWTTSFITDLSAEEQGEWSDPESMSDRVSPNGRYLAFLSARSLTGYDNTDTSSGQPDQEAFLYDAHATHHLKCVSCDPTGARPAGTLEQGTALNLVDHVKRSWEGHWLAATLPVWEQLENQHDPVYQPRYLSDNGRLFFNTSEALVPQDVNHQWDVYQFEPPGTGSCTTGGETYRSRTDGCVNLISSGTSTEESAFLDASEGGGDIFFLTAAKLTTQDLDDQLDVYDAHGCTAASPCVHAPDVSPPLPCTTAEECRAFRDSEPLSSGPPSASLSGDGNLPDQTPTHPRRPSRAEMLASALRACGRKPRKQRGRCRGNAIRRYGRHARTRRSAHSKKGGR